VLSWFGYSQRSFCLQDEGGKLVCFSTGPAIRNYIHSNLISEIIGTFVLIFVILSSGTRCIAVAADAKID
jgi:glycerol uptake facilitator protein